MAGRERTDNGFLPDEKPPVFVSDIFVRIMVPDRIRLPLLAGACVQKCQIRLWRKRGRGMEFLSQLINGLNVGGIYALIALG